MFTVVLKSDERLEYTVYAVQQLHSKIFFLLWNGIDNEWQWDLASRYKAKPLTT